MIPHASSAFGRHLLWQGEEIVSDRFLAAWLLLMIISVVLGSLVHRPEEEVTAGA